MTISRSGRSPAHPAGRGGDPGVRAVPADRLRDLLAALIITYVAINLPIVVWLMRDSFQAIPLEPRDRR